MGHQIWISLFEIPSVIFYCSDSKLDEIYEPLLKKTKCCELPEYVGKLQLEQHKLN